MNTLALAQTMLMILMPFTLYGQDLEGQWSGTLNVQGTELRLVLHVNGKKDQLKATLDSPDQNVRGIQVTSVDFNYPNMKFEIANLGVV